MSHILDIQPHHPLRRRPLPPLTRTPPPPTRSAWNQPGQTRAAVLRYLADWLAGWNCLVEEGQEGGRELWGREGEWGRDVFSSVC